MPHVVENDILIPEIRAILLEGRDVRFTPSGVSMRPFIEGGKDAVVLRHLPSVRVGDICLCDLGERYVLHRVIAVAPAQQLDAIPVQPAPAQQPDAISVQPAPAQQPDDTPVRQLNSSHCPQEAGITLQGDGVLEATEHCLASDIIGTVIRIENPHGRRKPLTRGRVWYLLRPLRKYLLKIYRYIIRL